MNLSELQLLAEHIEQALKGARLTRIMAPAPGSVALTFGADTPRPVLVISLTPAGNAMFLAEDEPEEVKTGKWKRLFNASFVKAVEHTCKGFELTGCALPYANDRIVRLALRNTDQYGVTKTRYLQVELTGRVSHMFVLTEEERVVSSLRGLQRPGTAEFRRAHRQIAAGKPLPPPPEPPADMEEETPAPLEEMMERERAGFAALQAELAGKTRVDDAPDTRSADALRLELRFAREAKSALAALGPFSLAPAGIEKILQGATSVEFVTRLTERGLLDEPIDYGKLMGHLQRLAGSVERLEKLLADQSKAPPAGARTRPQPTEAKGDAVSARLAKFPHKIKRGRTLSGIDLILTFSAEGNLAALKAFSDPNNTWFHARDFSGSYVLLLTGKRTPDPHDIQQAAVVAAANSKGREEASVEVCYTKLKYLKKPKSAKEGTILRTQETVISVRPDTFERIKGEVFGGQA